MKDVNEDYVNHWANQICHNLKGQGYLDAKVDPRYTCGTVEGGTLMTIQIAIDTGKKKPFRDQMKYDWDTTLKPLFYALLLMLVLTPALAFGLLKFFG